MYHTVSSSSQSISSNFYLGPLDVCGPRYGRRDLNGLPSYLHSLNVDDIFRRQKQTTPKRSLSIGMNTSVGSPKHGSKNHGDGHENIQTFD